MILKRLAIDRLPGIDQPFEIKPARQGIQVIFGPNGIGKSSICRAVEGLYWDDRGSSRQTLTNCEFEREGETWHGEREGSTVRWSRDNEANASPNFPASHNYRCFFLRLRNLIDPAPDGTKEIAAEIRRQMAGGFDLHELRADLFPPVSHRRKRAEKKRFNDASNAVQSTEKQQSDLQMRVDQLDELRSRLEQARTAAGRLAFVDRAIALARRRDETAEIGRQLAALPETLAKLTGKEGDEVEQHQVRLTKLEKRARALETELNNAREAQKESRLVVPLDGADLAAWREHADELGRIELESNAARTELESARNELIAALGAVGGHLVDNAGLTLPDHAQLFEFLRAAREHENRISAIENRVRLLAQIDPAGADSEQLARLHKAIEALRTWLRRPQDQSLVDRVRSRRPWLLVAAMMLFAGAGLAAYVASFFLLLSGFGAGLALAVLLVGTGSRPGGRRSDAQEMFEEMGLEGPANWDVAVVNARLQSLESSASELAASMQRARDRNVERQDLEAQLAGLRDKQPELDLRRQELQTTLGLEELPGDAELVDFARALDGLRLACGRYEAVTGTLQHLESAHTARLTNLADYIEHHGQPRPADAAVAKARLNALETRNAQLQQALADQRHATSQLQRNAADQAETQAMINRIYADAGLDEGDVHGLGSLLDALPQYRNLTKKHDALESQNELDRSALNEAGESALSETDAEPLERLKAQLEKVAAQADSLQKDIAETTAQTNLARRGSDLQDLIAVREGARANLRNLRDAALLATAGDFLIDEVERDFEATRLPRVFERAREHFSAFTFHNYQLHLEKGDTTPRLFAVDARDGQRRELDELSDGTRAQLLLAARIAFAEEVEQGQVLPLFLDEALDQSDPQRFEAIVRSLGRVARDQGRQIFYLTSDPLDVDRMRDAVSLENCKLADPIDLGLIRTGVVSIAGPETLKVEPMSTVPEPNGLSAEEYAAALGVPTFDPGRGFAEQHVFYVLWDDPSLLRDFLTNGIERAGQWGTVAGTRLAERLGARSIAAAEVALRIDLLEVFCELWKQGRGRPVDADALKDSGALSPRFFDDIVAITRELNGDARRLLATLDDHADPRLKGFRRTTVEALQSYLTEHRFRDERPIFDEDELRLRVLSSPAANDLQGPFAGDCLHRWWRWAKRSVSTASQREQD